MFLKGAGIACQVQIYLFKNCPQVKVPVELWLEVTCSS